ncbi:MAG: glycosyltransferase family 2 protein [Armatimonadetes bacterium]|nr:glycosyltransferase family 2 protein [Armatimonadota bacterium]MDW8121851.1 glycosyltransferase family 2 protein [Armatimonadota bacterium]
MIVAGEPTSLKQETGKKRPDISVVIANWNTADLLVRCLWSLRRACLEGVKLEVIVVDDASSDDSCQRVQTQFPEVQLLWNENNRGYAATTNRGAQRASGRYLLLLNPDTEVTAQALVRLLSFADQHPEAGAVAPRLVYPSGRPQSSVRRFPTPGTLFLALMSDCLFLIKNGDYKIHPDRLKEIQEVDQPMASALLIRRTAWEQIGGMDESLSLFFNDVDLCWQLRKKGWKIFYIPHAVIVHHHGASTRQLGIARFILSLKGMLGFYDKNIRPLMASVPYALLRSLLVVGFYARIIRYLMVRRG